MLFALLLARPGAAQNPDSASRPSITTVTGVVHDSISHTPLSGATVQLVSADRAKRFARTTISDSLGGYTLDSIPAGRYSIGFFHPVLESLGIEPPLSELFVVGYGIVRRDLATPSQERYREAVCGPTTTPDTGAIVVGIVRDARDLSTAAGITVTGEWLELTITRKGVVSDHPRLVATTAGNGWFAMCTVPSPGMMTLRATRDADSTDLVEVQLPAHGVVREELFLATMPLTLTRAEIATQPVDSNESRLQRVRTGDGRVRGIVLTADGGLPLVGARVGIVGGPQTRTNERGEWTIGNAPLGTRMLDIRSVGYYPERRAVNVVPDAAPVRVALSTLKAVLDTIKISASRSRFPGTGFEDRRRSGAGKYLTPEDIARKGVLVTSDLFRTIPGIFFNITDNGLTKQFQMHGAFGSCEPLIFVDGLRMPGLTASDIDAFFSPNEVAGIEIYSDTSVPAEFKDYTKRDPCGAIVIWRKWRR
jgi:hypothetical protein